MQLSISTYTNHLLGANMQYFTDPWRSMGILGEYGREGWCLHCVVLRRRGVQSQQLTELEFLMSQK